MLSAVCYRYGKSVCLSVRPSVRLTRACFTAERIIKIPSLSDRSIILVSRDSDFRPICGYISKTVIDGGIFTMTNIKSYVLYRIVPLSMTLCDPEPQCHSIVYRQIFRKRCMARPNSQQQVPYIGPYVYDGYIVSEDNIATFSNKTNVARSLSNS